MANATVAAQHAPAAKPKRAAAKGGIPFFRWLTRNWVWDTFILLCIIANAAILGYDAHYGELSPYHGQIEQWTRTSSGYLLANSSLSSSPKVRSATSKMAGMFST